MFAIFPFPPKLRFQLPLLLSLPLPFPFPLPLTFPKNVLYALNFSMLGLSKLLYAWHFRTAADRYALSDLLTLFISVRKQPRYEIYENINAYQVFWIYSTRHFTRLSDHQTDRVLIYKSSSTRSTARNVASSRLNKREEAWSLMWNAIRY